MGDIGSIVDLAQKITFTGGVLVIIWAGAKQYWVWGWLFAKTVTDYEARLASIERDRDEWKQRTLEQLGVNKTATDLLGKLVSQAQVQAASAAKNVKGTNT